MLAAQLLVNRLSHKLEGQNSSAQALHQYIKFQHQNLNQAQNFYATVTEGNLTGTATTVKILQIYVIITEDNMTRTATSVEMRWHSKKLLECCFCRHAGLTNQECMKESTQSQTIDALKDQVLVPQIEKRLMTRCGTVIKIE